MIKRKKKVRRHGPLKGVKHRLEDHLPKGATIDSIEYLPLTKNYEDRTNRQKCAVVYSLNGVKSRTILNSIKGSNK